MNVTQSWASWRCEMPLNPWFNSIIVRFKKSERAKDTEGLTALARAAILTSTSATYRLITSDVATNTHVAVRIVTQL